MSDGGVSPAELPRRSPVYRELAFAGARVRGGPRRCRRGKFRH